MDSLVGMPLNEKCIFHKYFLNMDISRNTKDPDLNFEMCIHHICREACLRFFYLGPSFYFIESRKLSFKKSFPFSREHVSQIIECETNIKRDINVQKIKVKKTTFKLILF